MEPAVREELLLPLALYSSLLSFLSFPPSLLFFRQKHALPFYPSHIYKHTHTIPNFTIDLLSSLSISLLSVCSFHIWKRCFHVLYLVLSVSFHVIMQDHTSAYIQGNLPAMMHSVKVGNSEANNISLSITVKWIWTLQSHIHVVSMICPHRVRQFPNLSKA